MSLALKDRFTATDVPVGEFRDQVPVSAFGRLSEALGRQDTMLAIVIRSGRAEAGMPLIEGSVEGSVALICQRCLELTRRTLGVSFSLAVVTPGGEDRVAPGHEALVLEDDEVTRFADLVEDELLLGLPLISRHERRQDCGPLADRLDELAEEGAAPGRESPFAVLGSLKK